MKRFERLLVPMITVGVLVLSGCASMQQESAPTSISTLGPSFKQEQIPADKAIVYIYRPRTRIGKIPFNVKANGRVLTILVPSVYYAYITEPSQIEFTAFDTGSSSSITVDAKAGQVYYLKGANGKWGGSVHLESVSPEAGASEIASCKLTTALDSVSAPTTATQQAVVTANAYGEKIFVGKIEYTSNLGLHIPPGRTLRLSSDNGDKLTVFVSRDIAIRDMKGYPTRIGEKAEVKYSSAASGDNEAISFRYVPVDYVQKPTELAVTTQSPAAATNATQMVLQKPTSSHDVQLPVSVAVGVKAIIGTVESGNFVKGYGFSHVDMLIYVLTDDGVKNEFYVRAHSSMFIAADGQHTLIMQLPPKVYLRKKVEISYSVIEDATGGLERFENGKNGVVSMRLVN